MSGEKPVRVKDVEIYEDEGSSGHSIVVKFSRAVEGSAREVLFTADALFAIAQERASEYEGEGKGDYEGLAVTLEDLEDDEEEEAETLPDPVQDRDVIDVNVVDEEREE